MWSEEDRSVIHSPIFCVVCSWWGMWIGLFMDSSWFIQKYYTSCFQPSIFPRCALSEGLLIDTPLPNSCFVVASGVSQNWSQISWASTLEDISGAPSRLGTPADHQQRIRRLPRQRMFAEFSVFRREPRSISKYHSRLDSLRYYQILGRRI